MSVRMLAAAAILCGLSPVAQGDKFEFQSASHLRPNSAPPLRLGRTSAPRSTARGQACDALPLGPGQNGSPYVINPVSYGADPTGATDSTAALQHCVELLWNASRPGAAGLSSTSNPQLDLGGATLDLGGGIFLLSGPVVFPAGGARNFQVRGGTLRAARTFPVSRFLLELNYTETSYVENAAGANAFHFDHPRFSVGTVCVARLSAQSLHDRSCVLPQNVEP
jgi:hypothetical protein